jgi:hypothetical protein
MVFKVRYHLPLMFIKKNIRDELERPQLVVDVANVQLVIDLRESLLVKIAHPLLLLTPPTDARD